MIASTRWTCPGCGSRNPATYDKCVTCYPVMIVNRPTPAPAGPVPAAAEVKRHLATTLRGMRQELNEQRLAAHQLGVKGYGIKHIADELEVVAEQLEKEIDQ